MRQFGVLNVEAGAVFFHPGLLGNEGSITGNGTLEITQLRLINYGTVSPGASPGGLRVIDVYQQESGTLVVEIGGTTQGVSYDVLKIDGTAILGGTLDVRFVNGFVPRPGDRFDVVTYANITRDFTAFRSPPGSTLEFSPGATAYTISVPASAAMSSSTIPQAQIRALNERFLTPIFEPIQEPPARCATTMRCD
jgi:hypothetical protein